MSQPDHGAPPGDGVEIEVEKLVYGGEGLARDGQGVLFVPFTAPGDRLRVRVATRGGRRVGEILEILEPSPSRRDPPCPHAGSCGGCQLQHLTYEAQLAAKAEMVRESLRRLGGIAWEREIPVLRGPPFGYRLRTQWKVGPGVGPRGAGAAPAPAIGYYRAQSHDVVDVASCPLLAPPLDAALAVVRANAARLPRDTAEVAAAVGEDGGLAVSPPVAGLAEREVSWRAAGVAHRFGPRAFFQVNRFLLEAMVGLVTGGEGGDRALDLFCGAGLFSLPLARGFREVTGVERDGRAVAAARRAAAEHGAGGCRFEVGDAAAWMRDAVARKRFASVDLVVADPPRAGLGRDLVRGIARTRAPRVACVSCDPSTLARDLKTFLQEGYALESVTALDLFPQTYHVETVAKLRGRG